MIPIKNNSISNGLYEKYVVEENRRVLIVIIMVDEEDV